MQMQNLSDFVVKHCLTDASSGWKLFQKTNGNRDLYTFKGNYVRSFISKSNKGGRVALLRIF